MARRLVGRLARLGAILCAASTSALECQGTPEDEAAVAKVLPVTTRPAKRMSTSALQRVVVCGRTVAKSVRFRDKDELAAFNVARRN